MKSSLKYLCNNDRWAVPPILNLSGSRDLVGPVSGGSSRLDQQRERPLILTIVAYIPGA
jgi:hypothetical protein